MPLDFDDVVALQTLGHAAYKHRVIGLFLSHRATPAQYAAMAEAVLRCSESSEGEVVEVIDRAVLKELPNALS